MKLQEKEVSAYEAEYQKIVERLMREMPPFKEAEQLLELVQTHFSLAVQPTQHPKVMILGSGFPEELVHAFGITPYWVLGGSLQTGAWAGELAPRDADPVSRSILGLMLGMEESVRDALILLPIVSDSTRKLAYLLRRAGLKVHTLDIPPRKTKAAVTKYQQQMELCGEVLSRHTGKRLTRRAFRDAAGLVAQAHDEIRRFLRLNQEHPACMTAPWRMLILFSYYCAGDIQIWTEILARLNDHLEADRTYQPRPAGGNVLLMGSPIYFPNYKIPFLLQDVGLNVAAHLDYTAQKAEAAMTLEQSIGAALPSLARRFYLSDCSGSYAINVALQRAAKEILEKQEIDGVVYCVLKGQIEYDFELERVEELCARENIPVFRLETDYSQQDVEQLRIRMEAFSEMLRQRQFQRGVAV